MLLGESWFWSTPIESDTDHRHADDVQINREMREVERWNDPAAEFMTVRRPLPSSPLPLSSRPLPLRVVGD